ncbi:MAG TPA: sigma-70 family RNA polymerase sigma factor [Planctomycetota bacterium]|nr:sigma-70 family RNA polymerase sigma factor [Planctomycetota bacterium]
MDEARPATDAVRRLTAGEAGAAADLFPLVYEELRRAAQRVLGGGADRQTLQPTALVHEAYLRLVDHTLSGFEGRDHFVRTAVRAMRQILVDHARARRSGKRGGGAARLPLDEAVDSIEVDAIDLVALDEALGRLAAHDERLARTVELRFFGGLTIEETARLLGVSTPTVERDWRFARSWLHERLRTR